MSLVKTNLQHIFNCAGSELASASLGLARSSVWLRLIFDTAAVQWAHFDTAAMGG